MKKSDSILSAVVLGAPAPIILALAAWWIGVPVFRDINRIFPFLVLAGAIAGLVLDITILRRFIFSLYRLRLWALYILEAFYSAMLFGVFMGFPVPCCLSGILCSYIVLRRGIVNNSPSGVIKSDFQTINVFSFALLLTLCICTAALSLSEPSIRSQLKSMLGLSFTVEMWMVWLLITAGGVLLLLFQYAVSRLIFYLGTRGGTIDGKA